MMIMAALPRVGGIVLTLGLLATTIGVAAAAHNAWSRVSATVGGRITTIEASSIHLNVNALVVSPELYFDGVVLAGTDISVLRSTDRGEM